MLQKLEKMKVSKILSAKNDKMAIYERFFLLFSDEIGSPVIFGRIKTLFQKNLKKLEFWISVFNGFSRPISVKNQIFVQEIQNSI